jgi:CHAD domain-containing protein
VSAGPYLVKKIRECDAAITAAAPRVLGDADDEAIHDLRVAIRRLRTLLKMSRRVFGRWHADVVRRELAEVMRATGDLRDEEVLEETLDGVAAEASFARWLGMRKARERKLRRAVVVRLERGDLDRARLLLKALLVFPLAPDKDPDLAKFARKTVERARRRVESHRDVQPDDIEGLHQLRIAYKELRYSIELLADALPIDARAMLEPATIFQKRLGELHDVDVAIEVIRHAKNLIPDVRESALHGLKARRDKRLAKYLKELDPLAGAEPLPPTEEEPRAVAPDEAPTEHGTRTNGAH